MTQKELLQLIGQELFPDWKKISGLGGGLRFRKPYTKGITDSIGIPTGTYREGFKIGIFINGYRAFDQVEDIMEFFCRKYNQPELFTTIKINVKSAMDWSYTPIESAEDLTPIYAPMREVVFDQILPFLERFNTLEAVYEHAMEMHKIRDTDPFALARFIHRPVSYRILILKRLLNPPDFLEYGDRIIENFKNAPQYDSLGFFSELFEYLKKM